MASCPRGRLPSPRGSGERVRVRGDRLGRGRWRAPGPVLLDLRLGGGGVEDTGVDALSYARAQMGLSLAFHIVFAAVGVALPVLHGDRGPALPPERATRVSRASAGGWPRGPASSSRWGRCRARCCRSSWGCCGRGSWSGSDRLVGLPFSLEGFAFFTEAIFLGIYLYGRERVSPRLHLFSGIAVAVSGAASAFFVTLVNAFMNNPRLPTAALDRSTGGDVQPLLGAPRRCTCSSPVTRPPPSRWPASTRPCCCGEPDQRVSPQGAGHRPAASPASPLCSSPSRATSPPNTSPSTSRSSSPPLEGQFRSRGARAPAHRRLARRGARRDPLRHRDSRAGCPSSPSATPTAVVRGLRGVSRAPTGRRWRRTHLAFQVMVGAGVAMAALAVLVVVLLLRRRALPDRAAVPVGGGRGRPARASSRWRRAGWSPSGAASPGSCAG